MQWILDKSVYVCLGHSSTPWDSNALWHNGIYSEMTLTYRKGCPKLSWEHRWLDLWCRLSHQGLDYLEWSGRVLETWLDGQLRPSLPSRTWEWHSAPSDQGEDNTVVTRCLKRRYWNRVAAVMTATWWRNRSWDGLPSGARLMAGLPRVWSGGAKMQSLTGAAECHTGGRRAPGARCGPARVALTNFVPGEAFSPLSLKLQCPSQLGFPAVAPGAPLPLSVPWVLSRERWHLPLALSAPLVWPLLASGSETCPGWGLGVGQTQDQAKGWWSWLTPSLD